MPGDAPFITPNGVRRQGVADGGGGAISGALPGSAEPERSATDLMARKAALFGDEVTRQAILAARTPGECKALGRRVSPYDDARWAEERFGVALDMLRLKFGQNARLRAALLATGEAELVEAAPDDRIWGIGFSEQDAPGARQAWGENLLGHALMAVRAELGGNDSLKGA